MLKTKKKKVSETRKYFYVVRKYNEETLIHAKGSQWDYNITDVSESLRYKYPNCEWIKIFNNEIDYLDYLNTLETKHRGMK